MTKNLLETLKEAELALEGARQKVAVKAARAAEAARAAGAAEAVERAWRAVKATERAVERAARATAEAARAAVWAAVWAAEQEGIPEKQEADTLKRIGDFEIIDHGMGYSQYFRGYGVGVAWVGFRYVATGIGDNPAEAIDDCLDRISQRGFDTEGMEVRIIERERWGEIPDTPDVQDEYRDDADGVHYHVSILWNEA